MINGMILVLYVKNVNRAANFWMALNFEELQRVNLQDSQSIILTNADFGNVTIQLYEIDFIRKNSPEVSVVNPNLIFSVEDIDEAYDLVQKETKKVSEVLPIGEDYSFSFHDLEGIQYVVRGPRVDPGLTDEVVATYFENLQYAKLINPRDIEFLPDNSYIFFGRLTSLDCRDFTKRLATLRNNLYYIDTENRRISPDLQLICRKYQVDEEPVFIRRTADGSYTKLSANDSLS